MKKRYNMIVSRLHDRLQQHDVPCYVRILPNATPSTISREEERLRLQHAAVEEATYKDILTGLSDDTEVDGEHTGDNRWSEHMALVSRERRELQDMIRDAQHELWLLRND